MKLARALKVTLEQGPNCGQLRIDRRRFPQDPIMRWPLRFQILLPMILTILVTVIGAAVANAFMASQRIQRSIDRQLNSVAVTLNESGFPLTENVLRQTRGLSGAEFAISDAEFQTQATSITNVPATLRGPVVDEIKVRQAPIIQLGEATYYHATMRLRPRRLSSDERPQLLHIFYPEETYRAAIRDAMVTPLWVGLAAILLAVAASWQIAGKVTRPIHDFRDRVNALSGGKLEPLPIPPGSRELQDLACSVNLLSNKLSRYDSEVRDSERLRTLGQLGAAMAHQLRNSVTGCKLALELHERDCSHADDESLQVASHQLSLMDEYLTRFLGLGRKNRIQVAQVSLPDVMGEVIAITAPLARHHHVRLTTEGLEEQGEIEGDKHSLGQMLINLVFNAVEAAAKAEGRSDDQPIVTVRLRQHRRQEYLEDQKTEENEWVIEVEDNGEGPTPSIRDSLFQPMVTDKPEGTGLGLTVAREIAEQHSGNIQWTHQHGWTTFSIHLPHLSQSSRESERHG